MLSNHLMRALFLMLGLMLASGVALTQTTTRFTYQGRLTDGGAGANGNYDLQFALFDNADSNTQMGQTQTATNVPVNGGVFTVTLDFGAPAFGSGLRFLEIRTRPTGSANFTTLAPRQEITASPYAIRSLNAGTADTARDALSLSGVPGDNYVKTTDARLVDPRQPTAGSSSYIQNTSSPQIDTNFNISGNGTAGGTLSGNTLNATTHFSIGGQRVLGVQLNNQNTFLGIGAGAHQTIGTQNSFSGASAGLNNTSGSYNAFFGSAAGIANTTGYGNAFLGMQAGASNTTGTNNVLIGDQAGVSNTTGNFLTAIGDGAGFSNTTEDNNTFIGVDANGVPGITNSTAIGANASVTRSNALVLGNNVNVGIGTTDPYAKLHVIDPSNTGLRVETDTPGGTVASFGGVGDFNIDSNGRAGGRLQVKESGLVDVGGAGDFGNTAVKLAVNGMFRVTRLSTGGTVQLCSNTIGEMSICSSSLRYKTDLHPFTGGLDVVNRLHPITFKWKANQSEDLGFGAEDVAAVEPLLVTRNEKGEVEGVKYDRLSAVFINAFKEQQAQIASLRTVNDSLNARLRLIEKTLKRHSVARRRR